MSQLPAAPDAAVLPSGAPAEAVLPLIDLRGITKTYRNGELAVEVLHGIDLQIYPGELVAIMGASGSGKSTLMNILGCLDKPTTGTYRFMGRDVSELERDELAELRRDAFGFVFQSYNLIATGTATDNVEVPAVYAGVPPAERHARAAELLDSLGLGERQHHRPNQLSGGQQQRVSIARALMNGGRVILADEPTGALDSKSGADVMALLKDLSAQGHTVILITHAAEVAAHAQRVIEIKDGHVVADPGPRPPQGEAAQLARDWTPRRGRISPLGDVAEAAKTALRALRANVFRAILTLLGIVIGVASVIAMLAIGDGAKQQVIDRISAMGSNLLLVRPGAPNQRGFQNIATLVLSDVQAIDKEVPNVLAAVPEQTSSVTLRFGESDYSSSVRGTSTKFPLARQWPVARGTFFSEEDEQEYATVAVLGQTVAKALFPDGQEPLGQYILVNNLIFQVIGVMSTRGASPNGDDQDDIVMVPYATSQLRLSGQRFLRNVTVAVQDVSRIDETQSAVESLLAERHGVIDFQIRNMASIIDTATETQNTMTVLLGSIAAISLLVGGIGVMNIMLVSVTERTREIGIRMATGARTRNILQQFLIEALVVSALGGVIGVFVGLGVAAVVGATGTAVQFSIAPVVLAFGCAFATGLIFGFLPARKAARLDPVVALASE
ncbi:MULTISPECIES: MacB family efflux pump subunit [Hydrogenophaga]|uniref:Pyoverdine export ATP-binding/permease protein PvdT n=1 Tax=Hydrogenophaga intermedia TaxID=65786 RepID=A0A1L1PJ15_HYDIT|nr:MULTISPECIES: MacB family efflux pump subunit [Hydrogenophaga]AOS78955.1 macrolide ABC transporter permease/ATP-binding protein MacB [Hydrogenophaga sp. PBC]TMU74483.1 MacB family efflux pump subunit [Hydrogenophaga intermedia]CDN87933.1 Macrolide export ATP-binding/permease protein macB [Hydrogenophaga intermedia]